MTSNPWTLCDHVSVQCVPAVPWLRVSSCAAIGHRLLPPWVVTAPFRLADPVYPFPRPVLPVLHLHSDFLNDRCLPRRFNLGILPSKL